MAIACIGACSLSPNACPKYQPPAFNPNPCWLLDFVFSSLQSPEWEKWDRVRMLVGYGPGCGKVFKPVAVEVEGEAPGAKEISSLPEWNESLIHGALSLPCGTRLLTAAVAPSRLITSASQLKKSVEAEEIHYGRFRAEGPVKHSEALDRIIEIARCAMQNLGAPKKLVVVYGW